MTPLEREIRSIIASEGPITLERYMELALTHPVHGYYMSRDPFGASGDFTTAPEISQMFGELLGLWAAEVWTVMGAPSPIRLVELGPGRGSLMADALRAARVVPGLVAALDVHLVEASPVLAEAQHALLAKAKAPITWHNRVEDVPRGPAIVIANEFFDALPVRHYVKTPKGWCERLVGLRDDRLAFGVTERPDPSIAVPAQDGTILEIGAAAHLYMARLARRLASQGGAALIIDYGHTQTSLGATLQALKAHCFVQPFETPGEADLTAHVDFAALGRAARAGGVAVHGPVTQGALLAALGIFERAEGPKGRASEIQREAVDAALKRLVTEDDVNMGKLFKALAVADARLPAPAGFISNHQTRPPRRR
ncbi:MAG: SAM-dependent methyltransferase [Methylobacteriaceae bacterium]|nr:SAM-dependent methyltransferase [Methylobacteriaceae bacterium]